MGQIAERSIIMKAFLKYVVALVVILVVGVAILVAYNRPTKSKEALIMCYSFLQDKWKLESPREFSKKYYVEELSRNHYWVASSYYELNADEKKGFACTLISGGNGQWGWEKLYLENEGKVIDGKQGR